MIATAVYLVAGAALHHRLPVRRPALQENICLHRRAAAPRCAADVRGDVQTQIQAALDADKVMAALDLPPPPPPPILAPPRSSRLECGAFALLSGWADMVSYSIFNCFGIMMTGNVISFAISIAEARLADALFFISLIAAFVGGVSAYRLMDVKLESSSTAAALTIAILLALTDLLVLRWPSSRWAFLSATTGFGLVNAASAQTTGVVTNMVTGHLQKLGNHFVDHLSGGLSAVQRESASISILGVLLPFGLGVGLGTAALARGWPARFSMLGVLYAALLLAGEGGAGTRAWARWRSKHSDAVAAPAVECADGEGVKCE